MSSCFFFEQIHKEILYCADNSYECWILVTPYIKLSSLVRLLECYHEGVDIFLFTRANMLDFAQGVSDLECWKEIWNRNGQVYVCNNLHAKYFRFDQYCFSGSANLTNLGWGYCENSNIEIMHFCHYFDDLYKFESTIRNNSLLLTEDDYEYLQNEISVLKQKIDRNFLKEINTEYHPIKHFLPLTLDPEKYLFASYCGILDDFECHFAHKDLLDLNISKNLNTEEELKLELAEKIKKTFLYEKIDHLFDFNTSNEKPFLSYGTISKQSGLNFSKNRERRIRQVNAVFDWLIYLYPHRYYEAERHYHSRLLGRY